MVGEADGRPELILWDSFALAPDPGMTQAGLVA
jgi:hypothetical protein